MPLLMVVISPLKYLVPVVAIASLVFLAVLGAIGARGGGAGVVRGHGSGDFLGRPGYGGDGGHWEAIRDGCLEHYDCLCHSS